MGMEKSKTRKEVALWRCKATCRIGKKACEGIWVPEGINRQDWIQYQMFCALEDLARAMEEK